LSFVNPASRSIYPSFFYVDAEVASSKSAFSMKFNTLLWLLTTGLQFAVGWWYRKQPVFFLPQGWLGPLGWWLALPFAPAGLSFFLCYTLQSHPCNNNWILTFVCSFTGSVSVGVWQIACRRLIVVGEKAVKNLAGLCHIFIFFFMLLSYI
jgi:hypothetical protein